ncbi:MAG TPA: flagellin [Steroidobacteraceae bacterium]|nr:flagellin [Steroidobacteraceae bacterium]
MSLVLNTNLDALVAQNSLSSSGAQLASALQQLSSGLRVNTAADDAAGYAIAQGMTSQVNGLNQAAQNANDGVSLTQTASGALSEITTDLQTMRDLAVESLNATNSAADRADLNTQFQQLVADINSVSANTQFNGVNLLDGSFQGATFQVGANAGQTITVASVASANSSALGQLFTAAGTAVLNATYTGAVVKGDSGTISIVGADGKTYTTDSVTLTGTQATDLASVAAAINGVSSSDGGLIATVNAAGTAIDLASTTSQTTGAITWNGAASNTGTEDITTFGLTAAGAAVTTAGNFLNLASVTSVDNSNLSLVQIDAALQQLATSGAQLGAYQNRFQAAITGLHTDATNLTAAKSAIVDADYAQATSNLSKAQILQQASTAMVAQANTIPQNILTLLQHLP